MTRSWSFSALLIHIFLGLVMLEALPGLSDHSSASRGKPLGPRHVCEAVPQCNPGKVEANKVGLQVRDQGRQHFLLNQVSHFDVGSLVCRQ